MKPLIRIIDDEPEVRSSLSYLFEQEGWQTQAYESAEAFLAGDAPSVPGCIVLDVHMKKMSGPQLQEVLNSRGITLPVIFFSGHGTLEIAVNTMRRGAVHFLEKTVEKTQLLSTVAEVMQGLGTELPFSSDAEMMAAYGKLTEQEKRIAQLASQGYVNGEIARKLGIAPKTVRNQKVYIKQKLCVTTPASLGLVIRRVMEILNGRNS